MWKRVLAAEVHEEAISSLTDPITAIHEEEEEQASKGEESLDEREVLPTGVEEEILPQSGEKEEEPEWYYELRHSLKPGIWTLSKFLFLS